MSRKMEELKNMICDALDEIAEKGEMSAGDLETIHKLVVTKEKLLRIEELEDDLGYSQNSYGQGSYSRDGEWMANGQYSRDNSYRRGNSYARGNRMSYRGGRYSMDGGAREKMMELLESGELNNSQKQALQKVINEM